jgi:hypothetical protein
MARPDPPGRGTVRESAADPARAHWPGPSGGAEPAAASAARAGLTAAHGPASSVADAVARLESTLAPLPRRDGVACFTRLYLDVTRAVRADLDRAAFVDPVVLERLDAEFATLYFVAVDAYARDPRTAPSAWVPLFEARSRRGIAPLQFAFAGMNAHINRDLPVALVTTCTSLAKELSPDSPQHADFERVNDVLARVESRLKAKYLTGWLNALDRLLRRCNRLDDVIAMWNVRAAREAAWLHAEALWALRGDTRLSAAYIDTLDRSVGFASRGLLVPADTFLRRLARRF